MTTQPATASQIVNTFKLVENLRFALDQSAIVAITDQTGKIEYVNDKFCQISKYSRDELIGRDHSIINSGYHSKPFMHDLWATIADGRVWHGELYNKAKDGSYYWVDTTIVPFLNDDGKPNQHITISNDITARKQSELDEQRRAEQFEAVVQVSAAVASEMNPDKLLVSVVELTKARFKLYHTHIYLLDEAGKQLVLTAGAGEPGRKMREMGFKIPFSRERSLVARTARDRKASIANDVTSEPDFLPNPLLPDTRSELAVPLIFGDELLGVLDVQSDQPNYFTQEDADVQTTLAAQIAVAVQNARAYLAADESRQESDALYQVTANINAAQTEQELVDVVAQNFASEHTSRIALSLFEHMDFNKSNTVTFIADWSPTGQQRLAGTVLPLAQFPLLSRRTEGASHRSRDIDTDPDLDALSRNGLKTWNIRSFVSARLSSGEQWFGSLIVTSDQPYDYSAREIRLLETVAKQISVALQRLMSQKQEIEAREVSETLYQLSADINAATTPQDLIDIAVKNFAGPQVSGIALSVFEHEDYDKASSLTFLADWAPPGEFRMAGNTIPLEMFPFVRQHALGASMWSNDVDTDPTMDDTSRQTMHMFKVKSYISASLVSGGHWLGSLTITNHEPHIYSPAEIRLFEALGQQVTITMQRLISQRQETASRLESETLYQVSALINAAQSEKDLIKVVAEHFNSSSLTSVSLTLWENANFDTASTLKFVGQMIQPGQSNIVEFTRPLSSFTATSLFNRHATSWSNDVPNDKTIDDSNQKALEAQHIQAFVAVPLIAGERWVGHLSVVNNAPHSYAVHEIRLLEAIGKQIVVSVERIFSQRQEAESRQEMEVLYRIGERINGAPNQQALVEAVAAYIGTKDVQNIMIGQWENADETNATYGTVLAGWTPSGPPSFVGQSMPRAAIMLADKMSQDQLLWSSDVSQDSKFTAADIATFQKYGTQAFMVMPLTQESRWTGYISVNYSAPHSHSESELRILGNIASQISTASERLRLQQQEIEARQESEQLYHISEQINIAQNEQSLVDAIVPYLRYPGILQISLGIWDSGNFDTSTHIDTIGAWMPEGYPSPAGRHTPIASIPMLSTLSRHDVAWGDDLWNDPKHDPVTIATMKKIGIRAYSFAPLTVNDQWIGSFGIYSGAPHAHSPQEIRLLGAIGTQIAVAVERMRLQRQTERRAREMETVAQVTAATISEFNIDRLLENVVELTKERFSLYHAHIYLLDQDKKQLTLAAGAGEAGRQMRAAHFGIPVNRERSLVARAARAKQGVVSNDVRQETNYLPNPLLPDTRAEMAVPMLVGDEVIGVLDVQADTIGRFTDEDVQIKSTLAGQIAIAIQNARAFAAIQSREVEISRRARELETVAQVTAATTSELNVDRLLENVVALTKERFGLYHAHVYLLDQDKKQLTLAAGAGEAGRQMRAAHFGIPVNRERSLVARAARAKQGVVSNDVRQETNYLPNPLLPDTRAEMAVPMLVGDEVIGVLDVQADTIGRFTDEDVQIKSTLAGQIAIAIQNARAFAAIQSREVEISRRARELETVAQVTAATTSELNVDRLLENVVALTKERFGLYHAHVYLLSANKQGQWVLALAAGAGEAGRQMRAAAFSIPLSRERSLVARAARTKQGVSVNDVRQEVNYLPNPLLPDTRSELAVPMLVGDEVVGVMDVQSNVVGRFSQEDILVQTVLAGQIAIAVKNAQQYEAQLKVADQLREVDRLKSEFLASMSHELRTPLNSIIGFSEVMADGLDGELPEEAQIDVEAIHESGLHLLDLINDVLDLAKIEAGHMELDLTKVSLAAVAEEVERTTRGLLKDKTIHLHIAIRHDIPLVNGDSKRLRQILKNLVSNGIKFTEQGQITITAEPTADGKFVQVNVQDTGMGIAKENLNMVFEQFRQVDSDSTRKIGGTGLGLPITRELVQMHNGTIWVESEPGVGSTFSFTIPIAAVATSD